MLKVRNLPALAPGLGFAGAVRCHWLGSLSLVGPVRDRKPDLSHRHWALGRDLL